MTKIVIEMEIYITDVKRLTDEAEFQKLSAFVPAERLAHIARCRNAADRARGLGAGLLLEYGLRRRGLTLLDGVPGCQRTVLAQGAYGKPYLAEKTDVCFNLSHAGDYAAAVFAGSEVGIDIERIRKTKQSLAKRFFTEAEAAYLEGIAVEEAREAAFTRIWTRKEGYIKAAGEGMHLPLADFDVLENRVRRRNPSAGTGEPAVYVLRTWEPAAGYLLSVCVGEASEPELWCVEPEFLRAEPERME